MQYLAKFNEQGERETSIVQGVHFATEEEKEKFVNEGFIEITEAEQALYVTNEYIRDRETGKPIARPPYVPTVEEMGERIWREAKSVRSEAEQAGCPYMGKVLDSDAVSAQRVSIAAQAAQRAAAQEAEFSLRWTMQDNSVVAMTAEQVMGMSTALAEYSGQLHERARQTRQIIEEIVAKYEAKRMSEDEARAALSAIKCRG